MNKVTDQSAFEERAERVLAITFRGIHHAPDIHKFKDRWECSPSSLSTYDFDELTRFVLACHHYAIRGCIEHSGPRRIKLVLSPRIRGKMIFESHPTIEEAIEKIKPVLW